jgi:acyl-CoA reductase-like NAD-dependent aldehyde dehydrogenase
MLWEWRRVSIPEWRRILQESIAVGDQRREAYARWMLREVLLDPDYQEVDS